MYQSGELIVYGGHGVCRVEQVAPAKEADGKLYYTLKPLYGTETIYIPVDTHVFMRPIITRQEAEELVRQIPFIQEDICSSRKPAELKNHYEECLQTHDCHDLVQLMTGVYVKNRRAENGGRRPGQATASEPRSCCMASWQRLWAFPKRMWSSILSRGRRKVWRTALQKGKIDTIGPPW